MILALEKDGIEDFLFGLSKYLESNTKTEIINEETPFNGVDEDDPETIAQISYSGPIYSYVADYFADAMRRATQSPKTKGILLSINSPGGDHHASKRMMTEVQSAVSIKPVFVHGNLIASGGYMAALPATKIFVADRTSSVGSIGVVFTYEPEFMKFLARHVKEIYSKHSPEKNSEYRALMDGDESGIIKFVDTLALEFQGMVKEYRSLRGNISTSLSGRMFTGSSSLNRGLIDGIATYSQTFNALKKLVSR